MNCPRRMGPELIRTILYALEGEGDLSIRHESAQDIVAEYPHEGDRRIVFHLGPIDREQLKAKIVFGPSCEHLRKLQDEIADLLMKADPNMLIILEHILILGEHADVAPACDDIGQPPESFPEDVMDLDDEDRDDAAAVFAWMQAGTVVVNASLIELFVSDEEATYGSVGIPYDREAKFREHFMCHLLSGVRQLGLSDPILTHQAYPDQGWDYLSAMEWACDVYREASGT